MRGFNGSFSSGNIRRRNWGRVLRDILLLPPALLYIVIEHVFWAGAKATLGAASRLGFIHFLQGKLRRLPALAVLPLFLIPEIISHLGGIWATLLLVQRKLVAATLVGIFVKGIATVVTVWIYQNCEQALMTIGWFARLHAQVLRLRDWAALRTRRLRDHAAHLIALSRSRFTRRFSAIRLVLAARFGLIRRRAHRRQAPRRRAPP
jgi:hypothetical protein